MGLYEQNRGLGDLHKGSMFIREETLWDNSLEITKPLPYL
jgi:hypothetical protein